jgi:hypothetical protein
MSPINTKQEYHFCCIPKKKVVQKKKNYGNIVILPTFDTQKEQDIFDLYLMKIYHGELK